MKTRKIVSQGKGLNLSIERLCHQLLEDHGSDEVCVVGIQPRGVSFSDRIVKVLRQDLGYDQLKYGKLDITFYRDDFRRREVPIMPSPTEMPFLVEGKHVVLIDDVLYTGRTIQAALAALQPFGRPSQITLMVLVDRRYNRLLPIQADYVGMTVDALDQAYVQVKWTEQNDEDEIILHSQKV